MLYVLRPCRSIWHKKCQVLADVKHLVPCCLLLFDWQQCGNLEKWLSSMFLLGERNHVLVQTDIGYYLLVWGRIQIGLELLTSTLLPISLFDKHNPMPIRNCILKVRKEWWGGRTQNILILCMLLFCLFKLRKKCHMFFSYPQIWKNISKEKYLAYWTGREVRPHLSKVSVGISKLHDCLQNNNELSSLTVPRVYPVLPGSQDVSTLKDM